jgi:hypothetical protein
VLHRRQIDIARRPATGALDLQPGKAAVNGLVYGRRRVDRLAVAPHPLVPAFPEQSVGPLQHSFGLGPQLGRLCGEDAGHCTRLVELLAESLTDVSGKGHGVVLRRHPGILESGGRQRALDYSNSGQQPSSSRRPVRR